MRCQAFFLHMPYYGFRAMRAGLVTDTCKQCLSPISRKNMKSKSYQTYGMESIFTRCLINGCKLL
jgi:hypothetical protein